MKKITLCLMLILTLIMPSMIFATEGTTEVAAVEGIPYLTLEEAIKKAEEIGAKQITLINNVVLNESVEISGEIELDLNGYTITPSDTMTDDSLIIVLHGGTLTVGDWSESQTGKINANNSTTYVGIKMTKAGCDTSKKATLIVDSGKIEGYYYGISGNGKSDRINTNITINGGTIKGLNGAGIYQPQEGKLTVIGGYIEGATGIEIRAGELNVEGGTIKGTKVPLKVSENGNGLTTEGAGIAVAQHTTKKDIDVNITGGNIKGYSALYQSNPQGNSEDAVSKVSLAVKGGNFEATNGGTQAIFSENKTGFVTDGTFNSNIEGAYMASDVMVKEDENGNFVAVKKYKVNVNVNTPENGTVTLSKSEAAEGEEIVVTATPNEGYMVKTIIVKFSSWSNEYFEENCYFMMPDEDVEVTVVFEEIKDTIEVEVPSEVEDAEEVEKNIIETLKELLAKNDEPVLRNRNLKAELIINDWNKDNVTDLIKDMKEALETDISKINSNLNITSRFINVFIHIEDKDTKEPLMPLESIKQPIKLNISLLEELPEVAEGYERVYYIVNQYATEDGADFNIIDAKLSEDGKTLEFSTDKLGLFNVAYSDVEKVVEEVTPPTGDTDKSETPEVPKTGDNVVVYAVLAVVAMAGMAVTIKMRKK